MAKKSQHNRPSVRPSVAKASSGVSLGQAHERGASRLQVLGGRSSAGSRHRSEPVRSVRLGDIQASQRKKGRPKFGLVARLVVAVLGLCVVGAITFVVLYNTSTFAIEEVTVSGADHITPDEMTKLAQVPAHSNLLRLDAARIESQVLKNPWVASVHIERIFPHRINIAVKERSVGVIVDVVVDQGKQTQKWALSRDGVWLMNIPAKDSPEAQNISQQIYTDIQNALQISDISYGVKPELGSRCTDNSILSALKVVDDMTTSLKDQVAMVKAAGSDSVSLVLKDGVEIMLGNGDNIREKERICLKLLQENPGRIAYINVRTYDRPTWRGI